MVILLTIILLPVILFIAVYTVGVLVAATDVKKLQPSEAVQDLIKEYSTKL